MEALLTVGRIEIAEVILKISVENSQEAGHKYPIYRPPQCSHGSRR